jgi:hypothetical protein
LQATRYLTKQNQGRNRWKLAGIEQSGEICTGDHGARSFRPSDDGSVAIWEMNGLNMIGAAVVANPGPIWHA